MSGAAIPGNKRRLSDDDGDDEGAKRSRVDQSTALARVEDIASPATAAAARSDGRSSALEAPIMVLSGHDGPITSCEFDPSGQYIASGSRDRTVFLWHVYGETDNYGVLRGHKNAVLDVCWGSGAASGGAARIYTASADKTLGVWDSESGARLKVLSGHTKIINAVAAARQGPAQLASVSDDGTVRIWDTRARSAAATFADKHPLLAVTWADDGSAVYAAGVDNVIRQWDVRRGAVALSLTGHADSVTGLRTSPDGARIASQSMDGSVRIWDIRPFVPDAIAAAGRCVGLLPGASNNFEAHVMRPAWSPDGRRVAAGSAVSSYFVHQ